MKVTATDPWLNSDHQTDSEEGQNCFEDTFISKSNDFTRLPDSDEYLARLNSRLAAIKGGTSKKDLINSLSDVKADCLARLLTDDKNLETEEEKELVANPVIRHIAPHLQALNTSELVHLLKADTLQRVTDQQHRQGAEEETDSDSTTSSHKDIFNQDCSGL